jgi:hypothetical protein
MKKDDRKGGVKVIMDTLDFVSLSDAKCPNRFIACSAIAWKSTFVIKQVTWWEMRIVVVATHNKHGAGVGISRK